MIRYIDVHTYHALPKDIGLEANLYTRREEGTNNSGTYAYDVEVYAYKTFVTFEKDNVKYSINIDGGLDCYSSVAKKSISSLSVTDGSYSAYAYPNVGFSKAITENTSLMVKNLSDYDKDGYKEICDDFGTPILILTDDMEDWCYTYKISEDTTITIDRKLIPPERYLLVSLGPNKVFDNFEGDDIVVNEWTYGGFKTFHDILMKFRNVK